jgi:hypothetical protein
MHTATDTINPFPDDLFPIVPIVPGAPVEPPVDIPPNPVTDAAPIPDHVLVTNWIAKPKKAAISLISTIVEGLEWPPDRVMVAIKAGVAAWTLQEWAGHPKGPSVTLTPSETDRRKLKAWSGKKGYEWADIRRKDRQQKKSFRVATKSRVILEADLDWDEDHVGGRAKIKGAKPQLSTLARISSSTQAYLEVIEDFERGSQLTKGEQGQEILEAAMGFGTGFHDIGEPWPDKYRHRHDEPGEPPCDPGMGGPCPDCEGKELGQSIYCPRCDRSGADRWVRHEEPLEKDVPRRRGPDKKPRKRKGEDPEVNEKS